MDYDNRHPLVQNIVRMVKNGTPNIYTKISDEVADEMGVIKNNITKGHNDERDAFRHAYTSALISYRYGSGLSKRLGDMNEYKNDFSDTQNTSYHEEWMDLYNNAVGIEIAMDIQLKGGSEQDLKIAVKDALDNKMLITTPYDPRRTFLEHGDWNKAVQEFMDLIEMDHLKILDDLEKKGVLSPDIIQREKHVFEEYQRKLVEVEKYESKNGKPTLTYSEPSMSTIKTGLPSDVNPTSVPEPSILDYYKGGKLPEKGASSGGGGGEVQVAAYDRATGSVHAHVRSWPDGDAGNNLAALRRLGFAPRSAFKEPTEEEKKRMPKGGRFMY